MYTLVSAIAKSLKGDERWTSVDISSIPIDMLFSTYSRIIATLTNPYLTAPVAFDFVNLPAGNDGQTITFVQYLASIGNSSLVTSNTLPVLNPSYAHYADAFKAGYAITPMRLPDSVTAPVVPSDKTSLFLTRENTDYRLFYQKCLVNVNGFFHLTDTDGTGVYVVDGMKSCEISKQNQIGIYSFNGIGNLTFIPITSNMVYKQNTRQSLSQHCIVNLGTDITNKTVMLVLGGYLHVLDNRTFFPVGTDTICINFINLPFLDRYYESKKYIDLSSLPLESTKRNNEQVGVADFYSDANITAYLTLSQSFFVVMDNPNIFVNRLDVRKTKMPDMFISYIEPQYPLIVGVGKIANYWSTYEDRQWSLNCHDSLRHNMLYDTVNLFEQNSVSNALVPFTPVNQSSAYFIEIGSDNI
jgi:hypothetical protein